MHGQVKGAATIRTDGWKAYNGLMLDGFKHHRVHHHENEFARASGSSTASNPSGALPRRAWPNSAACELTSSLSTSKNRNGAGTTAMITSTRCS